MALQNKTANAAIRQGFGKGSKPQQQQAKPEAHATPNPLVEGDSQRPG
jgi:hypothetical protein